jgi:hypothetical protein
VLSCALSCASFVTSICDKILVDNKESFGEILVHWESSLCAIGVVEVIYFHFASCLHSLDYMWRFKQSSLLEYS